ncbi:MAG: hypothetical protein Q4C78_02895 [Synergistaceae bacterium]|nr:hypothetical protein [Synergistaceae bacterium]
MKIDVVCPLYKAESLIDQLIEGIKGQISVELCHVIFPITQSQNDEEVIRKITEAGFEYFLLKKEDFSHSLTRQKAMFKFCTSDIVILITHDVKFIKQDAFTKLAAAIKDDIVFAYGRQICPNKSIEYYIRCKNYGDESAVVSMDDISSRQPNAFFASDAFAAYNRHVFVKLGGYGTESMQFNEDTFYAKKVLEHGYKKAYVADAIVEHWHNFTLKQLYNRYYETGKWISTHPHFLTNSVTTSGISLAYYVFLQALKDLNFPVLLTFFPNMLARYLGVEAGKRM